MSLEVRWERRASRAMARLGRHDGAQARRILEVVERYASDGVGDFRKLEGRDDEWRLRVGAWRVLFIIDEGAGMMFVTDVAPRRDAYR